MRRRLRDISDVLANLKTPEGIERLPAPRYERGAGGLGVRVGLAVESMRRHMTDEGWAIFSGLDQAGYHLAGYNMPARELVNSPYIGVNVEGILDRFNPSTIVVQDKREWDVMPRDFREPRARFENVEALKDRGDIFKLTILKDAHQAPRYHRQSADEMGVNGWVVYYHPDIVCKLAPYVRPQHLVRTYHSLDRNLVQPYSARGRRGTLLSGAVSDVYPLRQRLIQAHRGLPETHYLPHPGYHRNGCATPGFLKTLSHYKVSICTSSVFGYSLRKIMESTAAGCVVLTDLPIDEVLPWIDDNLVRVSSNSQPREITALLKHLYDTYDPEKQAWFAEKAKEWYDYRAVGARLAADIESLRLSYLACPTYPATLSHEA